MKNIPYGQESPVLNLLEGCEVRYDDRNWVILKIHSPSQLYARCLEGNFRETKVLEIKDLSPVIKELPNVVVPDVDLDKVSDDDWEIAKARLKAIKPLLTRGRNSTLLAKQAAENEGVSLATLYKWRNKYLVSEKLSSLLPTKHPGGRGKGRLSSQIENIINEAIEYLGEKPSEVSIIQVYEDIKTTCEEQGLPKIALTTFKRRIEWYDQRRLFEKRKGKKKAAARFDHHQVNTIKADAPLRIVQIDHCVVDVIVVHDVTRQPIYRPWLTIAIDVYSRMVVGIYLSLDHPSTTSVGACLAHAILPKDDYLRKLGVDISWPVWGKMDTLHMDNGADFRGERLKRTFDEYLIEKQFRPVGKPHYGAHIERYIGTMAKRFRVLPGATTNKPDKDKDYNPESAAAMTMKELEKWLVEEINKYHHRAHSGIHDELPIKRFEDALMGRSTGRPVGLPPRRTDTDRVKIDFLPEIERTIQNGGVNYDGRIYWSDVLSPWIGYIDKSNPRKKPVFRFKTDDRDISKIYFWDPGVKRWFDVPSTYTAAVVASRSEYRAGKKELKKKGQERAPQHQVFDSIGRQRRITENAIEQTTQVRRLAKSVKQELKKNQQHRDTKKRQQEGKPAPVPAKEPLFELPNIDDLPRIDGTF